MYWNHVCQLTNTNHPVVKYLIPGTQVVFKSSYRLIAIIFEAKTEQSTFLEHIQIQIRVW